MKFLKQLSLYTLVGVIGAGISFFVMPVLTHYLAPEDYGLLSLFNTYITILIPLVSISAYSLLSVEYFKQKDKRIFAAQFTSIQFIPLCTSFILAIIIWQSYGSVADDLELKGTGIRWGYIILAITFLSIYNEQFFAFLILQKKAAVFAFYSLLRVGIEVGLTFYFVMGKDMNWEGRMYSWLITSIIFFAVGLYYFHRQGLLKGPVKFLYIKEGLIFGAPLVLHGIGKFVVNQSDRIFIIKMVSLGEAGIYNIGYTVGTLLMIVVNAFFNYYSPFLMERLADLTEYRKLQIVKMSYLYMLGSLLLLVFIALLSPLFFTWFIDPQYVDGVKYVFWVALGYCFWGGYMLFSGFIFYYKKNTILAWLAVFNVVINLMMNYIFILNFGSIGAAYATALSFLFILVIIVYKAKQLVRLPWFNFKEIKSVHLS